MEDVKQAATLAERFLTDLFSDAQSVRLEEVEAADDGWFITLSFTVPEPPLVLKNRHRTYKRFHVADGEVRSMTIRELAGA